MTDDWIQQIRDVRKMEGKKFKPSPYLKSHYVDNWGVEQPVQLRDYQVQGIMNLLMVPEMILGDDTGLGKTIQTLSAIGNIFVKEPEYIPIVVTRKSSLYQWAAEVEKFMQGMETVTIDGEPFERDKIYEDFFLNHDPDKKRILITTYEILFRDMEEAVIRDKTKPTTKDGRAKLRKLKKALKETRVEFRKFKKELEEHKVVLESHFQGKDHFYFDYVKDRIHPPEEGVPAKQPKDWSTKDEDVLSTIIRLRESYSKASSAVEELKDEVHPPVIVPGILNYVKELKANSPDAKIMFVMDEVHALKNHRGKMHKSLKRLADLSDRKVGMTATPIKNRLMEFFSILHIIQPNLFPKVTHFQNNYCITKLQPIGSGRKVPVVVGHSKKQLERFVEMIEPYYLSRRKHEVAKELPSLLTREIICTLTPEQEELYDMAELGLLDVGTDPDAERTDVLKAMTQVQQASNSPQLLVDEDGDPYEGESSKLKAIVEMLSEDFLGVKTIVYSRFEKMITLIQKTLQEAKISCVRITGKENNAQDRRESAELFQNMESGIDVILITSAGGESINLHSAEHILYVDNPWSWGDYVQINGRAVRIGSTHKSVLITHMIARRASGNTTIDDYVIKKLRQKKALADAVAGESLKDGLKFDKDDDVMDIFAMIRDAQTSKEGQAKLEKKQLVVKKKTTKKKSVNKKKNVDVHSAKFIDLDLTDI